MKIKEKGSMLRVETWRKEKRENAKLEGKNVKQLNTEKKKNKMQKKRKRERQAMG